ncbi:MAG: hypothetical protein M5U09_04530 [Gammaproteobacteria bacterium]|nr:hypothetical protein [Gammaproteobacteria bacterium]
MPSEYGLGDAVVLAANESLSEADIDALIAALDRIGERTGEDASGTQGSARKEAVHG